MTDFKPTLEQINTKISNKTIKDKAKDLIKFKWLG